MGYIDVQEVKQSPPARTLEIRRHDRSTAQSGAALELEKAIERSLGSINQVLGGRLILPSDLQSLTYSADSSVTVNNLPSGDVLFLFKNRENRHTERYPNESNTSQFQQDEFKALVKQWRSETKGMSSSSAIVLSTPYQRILSMGKNALPYIFQELRDNYGDWFWALEVITGQNPVPPQFQGDLKKMREIWLDYGTRNSLVS